VKAVSAWTSGSSIAFRNRFGISSAPGHLSGLVFFRAVQILSSVTVCLKDSPSLPMKLVSVMLARSVSTSG
jgi:hypothetical protein